MKSAWVVLTTGSRPEELAEAVESIRAQDGPTEVVVVSNGGSTPKTGGVRVVELAGNVGIPGGRDVGLRAADSADIVFFLDDDARLLRDDVQGRVVELFSADPTLAVVGLRLVDEDAATARRHTPGVGGRYAGRSRDVVTFPGGACAVRRSAYDVAGGYVAGLWYGHEELDLAWRLLDRGYRVGYCAEAMVFHPHTPIGRHADGWRLTGRNRVWIARRNLPWPLLLAHTFSWLVVGVVRAPDARCRREYLCGWGSGWRGRVARSPIRWRTVLRLARLGRPPVI